MYADANNSGLHAGTDISQITKSGFVQESTSHDNYREILCNTTSFNEFMVYLLKRQIPE